MQGELVGSNMEQDLRDSFAVFQTERIGLKHLRLMCQVVIAADYRFS